MNHEYFPHRIPVWLYEQYLGRYKHELLYSDEDSEII